MFGSVRRGWRGRGDEWMRRLRLGFTNPGECDKNPVGTGGVLDVCLYLGCGGAAGMGGEWAGVLDHGLEG